MAPFGKKNNFKSLPTEWKPINRNGIILQLNGTAIKNCNGFQWGHFCPKGPEELFFVPSAKQIYLRKWGWNSKIPIKIQTCAKIYAAANNRQNDQNNKTEKDKNVQKVTQGLNKENLVFSCSLLILSSMF